MSDEPFHSLTSKAHWSEALERSTETPVLIFKHSSACPVSAKAHGNMQQLKNERDLPIYKLVVQKSRSLSDEIAEALDIRHETPQAILLHQEEPVFDASHFDVTVDTVSEALQAIPQTN